MARFAKIAVLLILLHFAALAFSVIAQPEYDGNDLAAAILLIASSKLLLIIAGAILLFHLLRWFVNRPNDGL